MIEQTGTMWAVVSIDGPPFYLEGVFDEKIDAIEYRRSIIEKDPEICREENLAVKRIAWKVQS